MNFDDAKEELNNAASKDKHLLQDYFKIASTNKVLFQDSLKIKHCLKTKGFKVMQGSGNRLPGNVIDYQKGRMKNSY
ncbi:hypothetical protein HKD37_19G054292 [Glycine soja]|nr:hypothetical protein GmHk_19G055597 [Glycine max]